MDLLQGKFKDWQETVLFLHFLNTYKVKTTLDVCWDLIHIVT